MKVFNRLEDFSGNFPKPIATIGNFDGVHLGHQTLLRDIVERAKIVGGTPTVMTFHPHPLQVLAPNNAPRLIQTLEQKLATIEHSGIDLAVVIPFTREFAQIRARDFAVNILWGLLRLHEVYVGPTFAFGHRREGSFNLLKEIGEEKGFTVGKIHQVQFRGSRVSSTAVRQALISGQVALARRLLGRPFSLQGPVVHGDNIGEGIRFPTANITTVNELPPRKGVYITRVSLNDELYPSVTSIGTRPTVTGSDEDAETTIETHILDFQDNLYGRNLTVEFFARLRDERRFPNLDTLARRIGRDVQQTRRYFRYLAKTSAGA
jgi:riboflavin kinase / FMN adenylyltransferase